MLEVAFRRDDPGAPRTTLWFARPGGRAHRAAARSRAGASPSPLRRRSGCWPRRSRSSTDGWSRSWSASSSSGMAASFLLGNLRDADAGADRPGDRARRRGDHRLQPARPHDRRARLHPPPVRDRAGSPASRCASGPSRPRRRRYARRRPSGSARSAARIAVAEERARIARELHDVVAHAVSVMVLQVGAVRHKLPDDARGGQRTRSERVEQTGRTALAEMRRLLGAMRRDGDGLELAPQPGLDSLDSLLEEVGRAGLPVRLHVDGERFPLPRAIDLSAYRIVQEGLTNALKHAHAEPRGRDRPLRARRASQIEVRDDGRGGADERRPRPRPRRRPRARQDLRRRDDRGNGSRRADSSSATRLPLGGDRP